MTEQQMREALLALRAVSSGLASPTSTHGSGTTPRSRLLRNNCYNSWQARRDLLNDLFDPLHARLTDLGTRSLASTLAEPISPRSVTGWACVDAELAGLRRHFQNAKTEQDYRNVGNDCVIVIEALSGQVYDSTVHLPDGEEEPPIAKTKIRIEVAIPDANNAELRKLARCAIEFAQRVKHSPTRRDAGIAADTVILLANLPRRLHEPS